MTEPTSLPPVVCTLTTKQQLSQTLEWRDLARARLRSRRVDGGVVVSYPIELVDGIEDLAAREAACCSFLDIVTTRAGDVVDVSITSVNPDAAPVIDLLAGLDDAE